MELDVGREVAALGRLTAGQLRARYAEVFGEPTNGHNKTWLVRRIAWRLQALAEGDLSERARRRAEEPARGAELRTTIPAARRPVEPTAGAAALPAPGDGRLPPPGAVITRPRIGGVVQVLVLPRGFEYAGAVYGSFSAVAEVVSRREWAGRDQGLDAGLPARHQKHQSQGECRERRLAPLLVGVDEAARRQPAIRAGDQRGKRKLAVISPRSVEYRRTPRGGRRRRVGGGVGRGRGR